MQSYSLKLLDCTKHKQATVAGVTVHHAMQIKQTIQLNVYLYHTYIHRSTVMCSDCTL